MASSVECLPSMGEALHSIPCTVINCLCGGTCTWEEDQRFKVIHSYTLSWRPARATGDPDSKKAEDGNVA